MKALLIGGDRSGCGKTSITLAIASLLSQKCTVQTFKTGMDYIDPSYPDRGDRKALPEPGQFCYVS